LDTADFGSVILKVPCLRDAVRQGVQVGQRKAKIFFFAFLFWIQQILVLLFLRFPACVMQSGRESRQAN